MEGAWKVAKIEDDSEFLNGMFGGMIDIVKEFEKFGNSLNGDEKEEEDTSEVVAAESGTKEASASEVMTQSAPSETTKDSAETPTFDGFTAIDNEACSVAIRSIDPNSSWGYEIQVALENKSPDKTYMFAVETAAVNGVETDPFFANEVTPGKKTRVRVEQTTQNQEWP